MAKVSPRRRKKVRLEDVARAAAISAGTASMALAGSPRVSAATRKRVLEACRSLDYQVPKASHRVPSKVTRVGLVCIGSSASQPPNSHLIHYLTLLSHQKQCRLEVASFETLPPETLCSRILTFVQPGDSLLLTGDVSAKLLRMLHEAGVSAGSMDLPLMDDACVVADPGGHHGEGEGVLVGKLSLQPGVIFGADDRAMGMNATQVLLGRGHRRIAFFTEWLRPGQSAERWHEGHRLALLKAGLGVGDELTSVVGEDREKMRSEVERLASLDEPPTAAMVLDMVMVNPLVYEFQAAGLRIPVPEMILWGSPELANLHRLGQHPMVGIDVSRWAEAGLCFALSEGNTRLPYGSHIHVPYKVWNLPELAGKV